MPSERLTESEINRLRGVVGLGTESSINPANNTSPKKQEKLIPTPVNPPVESAPVNNLIEPLKEERNTIKEHHIESKAPIETELFVKIDEHTEVAKELNNAKIDVKSIADTISLLGKAEKLKAEAIERLELHLNELDIKLSDVEEKLIAPEGLDYPLDGIDLGVSSDVTNLHKTLEHLKEELGHIE